MRYPWIKEQTVRPAWRRIVTGWLPGLAVVLGAVLCARAAGPVAAHPYDIRAYGATGDGRTLDSPAINRAILAAAAAGGGTVVFPPGVYLSGSLRLQDNITLYLEAGATLLAADEKSAAFDPPEPNRWDNEFHYQDFGHSHWQNSLIWGIGLKNVSILGPGLIHGRGLDNGFNRFADESKGEISKITPYSAELRQTFREMVALVSMVESRFATTAKSVNAVAESANGIVSATAQVKSEMGDLVSKA